MRIRPPLAAGRKEDLIVDLDRHNDFTVFYEMFIEGSYDKLLECISPGDVVIDAGANIGLFSLLASGRVGPKGLVLALEPNLENFKRLEHHIEVNHLRNVKMFQRAVAASSGESVAMEGEGIRARVASGQEGDYQVKTLAIDDLTRQVGVRPNILKMDIEGAESSAFDAMRETLPGIKALTIEVHDALAERIVREALSGFSVITLERLGYGPYLRAALHHPALMLRLEYNNRFMSVKRALHSHGRFEEKDGDYPINWFASRPKEPA